MRLGLAVVVVMVLAFSSVASAAELPPGGSFTDDDDNVHESAIEAVAAEGITRGCNPPGSFWFCPGGSITRGQMAASLVRALDLPSSDGDTFDDDGDSEFEGDIEALAASGITRGCNPPANTSFCPDDPVTRGQMAAFLRRAFTLAASELDAFVDDDGDVFEADINALSASGITKGCTETEFCPGEDVARDEMASFLARGLGLPVVEVPFPVRGSVIRVIDGDTIEVEVPFSIEIEPGVFVVGVGRPLVRLIGIDTPEVGEVCAIEATEAMKALVEYHTVRLDVDVSDGDSFNRLLRNVFLSDGTFVNEEMVRAGWALAVEYPPDTRYAEVLELAEAEAQAAGRGQWGGGCGSTTTTTEAPSSN